MQRARYMVDAFTKVKFDGKQVGGLTGGARR